VLDKPWQMCALLCPGGIFIGTMPDANVIIKKLRECMSESDYLDLMLANFVTTLLLL